MLEKFQAGDFGHCPRVYCECQPMLPLGIPKIVAVTSNVRNMIYEYHDWILHTYNPNVINKKSTFS